MIVCLNRFLCLVLTVLLLSACGTSPFKLSTEQELYDEAKKSLRLRNFSQATIALEELEARFPFGTYAEQAQLDLVYARYSGLDLEGAILAADRFIRLHPQSPNVDYAYYIRGLSNYNLDIGFVLQYFDSIDVSSRDPGSMRVAFADFSELLARFPDSQYAADAQQRMVTIRNRIAAYELHAARYYIRREAYLAAANRAAYVVTNFPQTPVVKDALMMMVELYDRLGLKTQLEQTISVVNSNYPETKLYDEDGVIINRFVTPQNRSLLSVVTFGLFK